jgi:NADH-quinone oxidoreductase subunit A
MITNLYDLILSPPIALLILLGFVALYYAFLHIVTPRLPAAPGLSKPYACGEEQTNTVRPDYGQFFPFAFFFTILHVVALTVATVPVETGNFMPSFMIAMLYVACALVGMSVLYRRYE